MAAEQVTISFGTANGSPTINIDWGTVRATAPVMVH